MRIPIQVLIFPYQKKENEIEYCILRRSDLDVWQGVAGGSEEGETPLITAARELEEELNIIAKKDFIKLDSICTIPVIHVTGKYTWGNDVYQVTEHAFGIEVIGQNITLSREHSSFEWVSYKEASNRLKWDSNRNALWELNERLKS